MKLGRPQYKMIYLYFLNISSLYIQCFFIFIVCKENETVKAHINIQIDP